jgi:hypothetical protein
VRKYVDGRCSVVADVEAHACLVKGEEGFARS